MSPEDRETYIRYIAANTPPMTTWQQVADFVDESTWERILGDLAPRSLAEALACRPSRAYLQPDLAQAVE